MQLIPRYLVNNRTTVLVNETGLITEYRPVYTKQIKLSRGIDNVLQFKLLNADQKAVTLTGKTAKFTAFDENKNMIIQRNGTPHATITGLFTVSVTESELLNLPNQFISYDMFEKGMWWYKMSRYGEQVMVLAIQPDLDTTELRFFENFEEAYYWIEMTGQDTW